MRTKHRRSIALRLAALVALAVAFAGSTACNRKKVIEVEPRFSINVARVPSWYPEEKDRKKFTAAQHEVLNRRGRPSFVRFWWDEYGELITTSDLSGRRDNMPELMGETKTSWIYTPEDVEIEFLPEGGYREHPLSEQLRLVCRYGDPSRRSTPKTDDQGRTKEVWSWIDRGLQVELVDGRVASEKRFPKTGRGTDLLK